MSQRIWHNIPKTVLNPVPNKGIWHDFEHSVPEWRVDLNNLHINCYGPIRTVPRLMQKFFMPNSIEPKAVPNMLQVCVLLFNDHFMLIFCHSCDCEKC